MCYRTISRFQKYFHFQLYLNICRRMVESCLESCVLECFDSVGNFILIIFELAEFKMGKKLKTELLSRWFQSFDIK